MTVIPIRLICGRPLAQAVAENGFIQAFGVTSMALGWDAKELDCVTISGVHPLATIEDRKVELPRATFVIGANRWDAPAFLASGRVAAVIDRYALVNWARRGGIVGFWAQGLPELVAKLPAELEVQRSPVVETPRCCTFGSGKTQLGLAGLLSHYLKAIVRSPP